MGSSDGCGRCVTYSPGIRIVPRRRLAQQGVVKGIYVLALHEREHPVGRGSQRGILVDVATQAALVHAGAIAVRVLRQTFVRGHGCGTEADDHAVCC